MDQEWALLRRNAQHADAAGTSVPLSGARLLRLMADLERAEAERDAALSRTRRLLPADVVGHVDMLSGEVMRYEREGDGE